MGLAPAQKAKKGRFGAGGTAPDISVSAYPVEVDTGVATGGFTASASDDVDGDISASITWTSDLDGAVGTGGSPTITLTTLGEHVITVEATATTGGATTSTDITVDCVTP